MILECIRFALKFRVKIHSPIHSTEFTHKSENSFEFEWTLVVTILFKWNFPPRHLESTCPRLNWHSILGRTFTRTPRRRVKTTPRVSFSAPHRPPLFSISVRGKKMIRPRGRDAALRRCPLTARVGTERASFVWHHYSRCCTHQLVGDSPVKMALLGLTVTPVALLCRLQLVLISLNAKKRCAHRTGAEVYRIGADAGEIHR